MAEESQAKRNRATLTQRPLKQYATDGDQFQTKRYIRFGMFVIVPFALLIILGFTLTSGNLPNKYAATPRPTVYNPYEGKLPAAPLLPASATATPLGTNQTMMQQYPSVAQQFGTAYGGTVVPMYTLKCYALIDAQGVYSATNVLQNGMFRAERFTRVSGGMIYNSQVGWYHASDFGCQGDLGTIEVEFYPPTQVPTRRPTVRPSPTVPMVVAPVPTFALRDGIAAFGGSDCASVTWLAWNIKAVYLNYGGKRIGVAGDSSGNPVTTSICPYVGDVTLEAVTTNGTYRQTIFVGVK